MESSLPSIGSLCLAASPPARKPELASDSMGEDVAAKRAPIQFGRHSNLQLIVGPSAVQMQVDANVLRHASIVFDRMLFGPFIESNQTTDWTVELPEDNPEALEVILHAAHCEFECIPPLKLSAIYDVMVTADKYAMLGTLRPCAIVWTVRSDHPELFQLGGVNETSYRDIQRLFVMYSLGNALRMPLTRPRFIRQTFEDLLTRLVLISRVNSDGDLLFSAATGVGAQGTEPEACEWKSVGPLPDIIINFAGARRRDLISRLLGELNTAFTAYAGNYDSIFRCICHSTALGLLVQHLVRENLWPVPSTDGVYLSVTELSKIVDEISLRIKRECSPCKWCPMCELKLPRGFWMSWRSELELEVRHKFGAHFTTRPREETSGS